jgi:hypothetical protein
MLELAKVIYDAIGIESPRKFIAVCALAGALIFTVLGWLVLKGAQARLREQTRSTPAIQAPIKSGNASTSGDKSPAVTGNGNSFTYDQTPEAKKPKSTPHNERGRAMRYGLVLLVLIITMPCLAQTTQTGEAKTSGPCSPAVSGSNNQFSINCQGIGKEQGQKMLDILNKILANQLDPEAVMAKLDEILKAVNPNVPTKTYFCNGLWRTAGPGPHAGLEITLGGDDSAFQEMVRLNNSGQYQVLLKTCLAQIDATPEWLTPRLFCGLAYLGIGEKAKAKEMLKEFDSKTGPAYDVDACHDMTVFLHDQLR